MIDWSAMPAGTRSDLERSEAEIVLCVPGRNPVTEEKTVETLRVPLSVLREWLKDSDGP